MSKDTADIRRRLAALAGLAEKSKRANAEIERASDQRQAEIDGKLAELRPRTLTDPHAAAAYQGLIHERGLIDVVLGRVRAERS